MDFQKNVDKSLVIEQIEFENCIFSPSVSAGLPTLLHWEGVSRLDTISPIPLSRQACKISCINEKNPAKHIKSPAPVGKNLKK